MDFESSLFPVNQKKEKIIFTKGKKEKVVTDSLNPANNTGAAGNNNNSTKTGNALAAGGNVVTNDQSIPNHLNSLIDESGELDLQALSALTNGDGDDHLANLNAMNMKNKKQKQYKAGKDHQNKTRAARAGLVFPVARIHSKLKAMVPSHCRVGGTAAVFLAAVIEYLVAELCELSGNRAKKQNPAIMRQMMQTDGNTTTNDPNNPLNNMNSTLKKRKARITPRFLQYSIHEDPEFAELLGRVTLSGGGVVPLSDKELRERMGNNSASKKSNQNQMNQNPDIQNGITENSTGGLPVAIGLPGMNMNADMSGGMGEGNVE